LSSNLTTPIERAEVFDLSAPQYWLDGDITLYPNALNATTASHLYQQLHQEIHWRQETLTLYGKQHLCPRLQSWIGEPDASYRYSGKTFTPEPWTPTTGLLTQQLNQQLNQQFNAVLANLYRSGQDSMGWHSDDEPELGLNPVVASLSLGAVRDFSVRKVGDSRRFMTLALPHGSLLIMNAGMQQRWQHALPKRARVSTARINLTFRRIVNR